MHYFPGVKITPNLRPILQLEQRLKVYLWKKKFSSKVIRRTKWLGGWHLSRQVGYNLGRIDCRWETWLWPFVWGNYCGGWARIKCLKVMDPICVKQPVLAAAIWRKRCTVWKCFTVIMVPRIGDTYMSHWIGLGLSHRTRKQKWTVNQWGVALFKSGNMQSVGRSGVTLIMWWRICSRQLRTGVTGSRFCNDPQSLYFLCHPYSFMLVISKCLLLLSVLH